ncbi:MAG: YkgJ family cysteine cluster protein [Myxococcales bacterium]|nr:YkgJ family cysteine cluster protein [Myxococcales bacterium]
MNKIVPPLRHGVILERDDAEERPVALFDRQNRRRIKLDATSAAVVALLDREQALDELVSRAAEGGTAIESSTLESILAFLARYRLLEPELVILEGDAFDCAMCGSSCGGHNIGPVDAALTDWLRPKQDELLQLTGAPRGGLFVSVALGAEGHEIVTTRMNHGSCVFLDSSNLCALHARYGAEHKPHTCHVFPFHFVETPDGIVVSYQMECRRYIASKHKATVPLREQTERLREMIRGLPSLPRVPEAAELRPGFTIDFAAYREFERRALGIIAEASSLRQAFRAVACLIGGETRADEGETRADDSETRADDSETRGLGADGERRARGGDDATTAESYARDLDALRELVAEGLVEVRRRFVDGSGGRAPRLDYLERTVAQLGETIARAMRPDEAPESIELWSDAYRHFFHSKEALQIGDVQAAHALFVFKYVLAHSLAHLRAQEVGRAYVDPRDTADAVVVLNYLFRSPAIVSMLLSERERIVSLFERRISTILFDYQALGRVSDQTEFWLF